MTNKLDELAATIDPINFIIQDVLRTLSGSELEAKNNLRVFDGYSLDVMNPRKHNYRLSIRTDYMKNICTILIDKTGFVLKYSTAFYLQYKKTKSLFSTNLADETFIYKDLKSTFEKYELFPGINYEELSLTLHLCKRLYDEIDFG